MARQFIDDSRFWVIFDTSTRPAYYRDVHNLLAAPLGASVRYDYRAKYLSEDALAAISDRTHFLPARVLLAYIQHRAYRRGVAPSEPLEDFRSAIWIPTRIGRMRNVFESAGEYFFDFEVLSYPCIGESSESILKQMFQKREAPFWKWVAFSTDKDRFARASAGTDDGNWASIVDVLAAPPSQFSGDVFWRVTSIRKSQSTQSASAGFEAEMEGDEVRQVRSFFALKDSCLYSMEIATKRSQQSRTGGSPAEFRIKIESDDKELLRVIGGALIDVRQYTREHIDFECKGLAFLLSRGVELALFTTPADGDWPQGAELKLRFKINKNWGIAAPALLLLAIGTLLASTSVWKFLAGASETLLAGLGAAAGAILIALGATLWTGKLSSK